jgi:hypothetical protein
MRPIWWVTFAGFAAACSIWTTRSEAAACSVDTDCLDNGITCGTDVCTKSGTCVPAGSDPGTCTTVGTCKCNGLFSVLCNPQNHTCTITSADGGLNSSGGGTSGKGSGGGGQDAGVSGGFDAGATPTGMDASIPQGSSGSTASAGSQTAGGSSGTLAVTSGGSSGTASASGTGGNGTTSTGTASGASASGVAAGGTEPAAKSSGCTLGFGAGHASSGLLGIAIGAWSIGVRRRRRGPAQRPSLLTNT